MSEDAPSWGALEGKTWGEISQRDRFLFDHDGEHVHVPVSEDIQKTLDNLRADVETLKARVGQLERTRTVVDPHEHDHCWHPRIEPTHPHDHRPLLNGDRRCCCCSSDFYTWPPQCYGHPREGHGEYAERGTEVSS